MKFDECKSPPRSTFPDTVLPSINESHVMPEWPKNYATVMGFCGSSGKEIIDYCGFDEVGKI